MKKETYCGTKLMAEKRTMELFQLWRLKTTVILFVVILGLRVRAKMTDGYLKLIRMAKYYGSKHLEIIQPTHYFLSLNLKTATMSLLEELILKVQAIATHGY